ncbi:MAG: hypothetical protein H0X28_11430 [Solirubrobacterales bacterium]|nr:hypothetical protein [Solirubrobacterales bacterium]
MSTLDWSVADEPSTPAEAVLALVRRGDATPPWAAAVVARLEELADLDTVDPQVERPLNIQDARDALRFLARAMQMREDTCLPWIGRLSSGGVQLAWKHADVEVEAVFDRLRSERELLVSVGDNEWDAPADKGDSLFASVVDRLSNSYIAHAPEARATVACS